MPLFSRAGSVPGNKQVRGCPCRQGRKEQRVTVGQDPDSKLKAQPKPGFKIRGQVKGWVGLLCLTQLLLSHLLPELGHKQSWPERGQPNPRERRSGGGRGRRAYSCTQGPETDNDSGKLTVRLPDRLNHGSYCSTLPFLPWLFFQWEPACGQGMEEMQPELLS